MKASINAITNGTKVRDTNGRLKTTILHCSNARIALDELLEVQFNTSVTPASKIHTVVVLDRSTPVTRGYIMHFELIELVNGVGELTTIPSKKAKKPSKENKDEEGDEE
jgi:hypothetical protein